MRVKKASLTLRRSARMNLRRGPSPLFSSMCSEVSIHPQQSQQTHHHCSRSKRVAHEGSESEANLNSTPGWNDIRERLEQLLLHGLDGMTWEALQRHSLAFVADELLWRVEAIAKQVPQQGTMYLEPIARVDFQDRDTIDHSHPGNDVSGAYCSRRSAA